MKRIALVLMAFVCVASAYAKIDINVKKVSEKSASFVVNAEKGRTLLVVFPKSEMLPDISSGSKFELPGENVDLTNLKPIKNNAFVVFDGEQDIIPITIKGLTANSPYVLALLKPATKDFKAIEYDFATLAIEPDKQAKGIAFRQPTESTIELVWVNGNGDSRVVVAKKGKGKITPPEDGKVYEANAKFGNPKSKVADDTYIVYTGNKQEFKVEGLDAATYYTFAIYESRGKDKSINYLTSETTGNPRYKMTAIPAPVLNSAKDVSEIGFVISWKSLQGVEKFILDIAYDEEFTKFADTYNSADVGDINEIEVTDLDPSKSWFVRVKAVAEGTESNFSKTMKVK